ncbi:MAG: hypothetical protein K2N67_02595 [Mucispirillum sp.]|nr:hypothetical protein [Mucispirillum sp.]
MKNTFSTIFLFSLIFVVILLGAFFFERFYGDENVIQDNSETIESGEKENFASDNISDNTSDNVSLNPDLTEGNSENIDKDEIIPQDDNDTERDNQAAGSETSSDNASGKDEQDGGNETDSDMINGSKNDEKEISVKSQNALEI